MARAIFWFPGDRLSNAPPGAGGGGDYAAAIPPAKVIAATMEGIQIENVQSNSILRERGIQAGDVIRSVNGIPITSQDQGNDLMNTPQIRNATRYDVVIERQGQTINMTYEVGK